MTISEKIDKLLEERNMSRRQLAFKAGISPSTLQSALSRNKTISVETLQKICLALEISLGSLLGYPDDIAESIAMQTPKDQVELDESGRAKFYYDPADEQAEAHFNKYQTLNKAGRAQVDSYTDYIASNPANRIDQQPQEPSANTRTIEYAAWGVGPATATVNVDEETLRAAQEEASRRQADRLMAERDRAAAAKKGFGRKRKK